MELVGMAQWKAVAVARGETFSAYPETLALKAGGFVACGSRCDGDRELLGANGTRMWESDARAANLIAR